MTAVTRSQAKLIGVSLFPPPDNCSERACLWQRQMHHNEHRLSTLPPQLPPATRTPKNVDRLRGIRVQLNRLLVPKPTCEDAAPGLHRHVTCTARPLATLCQLTRTIGGERVRADAAAMPLPGLSLSRRRPFRASCSGCCCCCCSCHSSCSCRSCSAAGSSARRPARGGNTLQCAVGVCRHAPSRAHRAPRAHRRVATPPVGDGGRSGHGGRGDARRSRPPTG